jgi:hypothetical protein
MGTLHALKLEVPAEHADPVSDIFEHWAHVMGYRRARLDDKRRRVIRARLKDGYSIDDLKDAIDGCYLSPFHHDGDNDHGQRYDEICLILRDAEHVDKFMMLADEGKKALERAAAAKNRTIEPTADRETALKRLQFIKKALGR